MDSTFPREGVRRSLHPLTSGNSPFHGFSNFSWTIQGKSLDTGKTVLILVNLPSCQWHVSSKRRYIILQSGKNLQTFLWLGWGGGQVCAPPHHTNVPKIWWLLRSYVFVCCQQITFKRDNFTKRALSSRVDGFSLTYPQKSWKEKKNVKRSIWIAWHVSLGQPGQRRYYTVVIFGGAWD